MYLMRTSQSCTVKWMPPHTPLHEGFGLPVLEATATERAKKTQRCRFEGWKTCQQRCFCSASGWRHPKVDRSLFKVAWNALWTVQEPYHNCRANPWRKNIEPRDHERGTGALPLERCNRETNPMTRPTFKYRRTMLDGGGPSLIASKILVCQCRQLWPPSG